MFVGFTKIPALFFLFPALPLAQGLGLRCSICSKPGPSFHRLGLERSRYFPMDTQGRDRGRQREACGFWRNQSGKSLPPPSPTRYKSSHPQSRSGGSKARFGAPGSCLQPQIPCAVLQRLKGTWGNQNQTEMQSWWTGETVVPWGSSECLGTIWLNQLGFIQVDRAGHQRRRQTKQRAVTSPLLGAKPNSGGESEDQ